MFSSLFSVNHSIYMMQNDSEDTFTDPLVQQLCNASRIGDLERVKTLFAQWRASDHDYPPNLNHPLELFQPALRIAASSNQVAIVSYLLSKGLDCDKTVVKAAISSESIDALQTLLDYGWDINKSLGLSGGPYLASSTVLKNERLLAWFLAHGASPNAPLDTGRTAMDAAAWLTSPHVVTQLLQHGGTISNTNALHMAVRSPESGRYEMVEYLLKAGADIDAIEYAGTERLSGRASSGFGTALHYKAREGRKSLMYLLLERGANIGIRDTLGRTVAEVAEKAGHLELVLPLSVDKRNKL